jgi:CRP-like cAMP-binding protein
MRSFSKVIELNEGDVLFNQGDLAENFYYVHRGLLKLFRHSPDGQEKIVELEKPGSVFAEALMFHKYDRYPVGAASMKTSTVVAISTSKFLNIIKDSMDTGLLVMGDLSQRLHQLIMEIERLSLLNGRMRIATYVLDQYLLKGRIFTLEVPKNAVASLLALKPESFSRLLKELTENGIIKVDDNKIEVLDDHLLRKYAGIS